MYVSLTDGTSGKISVTGVRFRTSMQMMSCTIYPFCGQTEFNYNFVDISIPDH